MAVPTRTGRRPVCLKLRSSTGLILTTVCVAIFADNFLYSIIVPIFPFSLMQRIHVSESDVPRWLSISLAVYAAAQLVGSPIFGFFADKIENRRLPLLIGLVALISATPMLCLATSLRVLLIARALQGFSASCTWVVSSSLLADTAQKDSVAQLFGWVGAASSLGTILGPVLGGVIYERAGYYSPFALGFAFLVLDIILRLVIIEKRHAAVWLQDPVASDLETRAVVMPVVRTTTSIPTKDADSLTESVVTETSGPPKRKLPAIIVLWKSPRILTAFWGDFVIAFVMTSFETTLTLFVSRTFGWSSLEAGLVFIALLLPAFLGPLLGVAADRYGARWISAIGLTIMVPCLVLLRLVYYDSAGQIVLLCALLAFIGVGAAGALTGLYAEYSKICDDIERNDPGVLGKSGGYAQCYGIAEIASALAGLVGPLVSEAIYENAGWGTLGWALSIMAFSAVIPTMLFVSSNVRQ